MPALERTTSDDGLPPFLRDCLGHYAVLLVTLGVRTGLLDAVLEGPCTADQAAARSGTDTRSAREWLCGMTAAGYLSHDRGTFVATAATLVTFRDGGLPVDTRAVADLLAAFPALLPDVETAMRTGHGIAGTRYAQTLGPVPGRINTPTYADHLVTHWLPSVPELVPRLQTGVDVLEVGCGTGAAAAMVAHAFPGCRVTGFDPAGHFGNHEAANLMLTAKGVTSQQDVIMVLDALHHFGDEQIAVAGLADQLRPGGTLVVVESTWSDDVDLDAARPMAVVAYTAALTYCMQDNLASGGTGRSCALTAAQLDTAFEHAGLQLLSRHDDDTGYTIHAARKPPL